MKDEQINEKVRGEVKKYLHLEYGYSIEESFRGNFERIVGLLSGMALAYGGFLATTGWLVSTFGIPGSELVWVAYYLGSVVAGLTVGSFVMDKFFKGATTTEVQQVRDLVQEIDNIIKERDRVIKAFEKTQSDRLKKEFERHTKKMKRSGKRLKNLVRRNVDSLISSATVKEDEYVDVEKHINGIAAYADVAEQGLSTNLKNTAGYILKPR